MKLCELFGRGRTVFSCEVFPPKRTSPVDSIYQTLDGLKDIKPDFISVTFGAGGSQVNQTTREIAGIIQNQYHIPAMAHLTCVGAGRAEVDEMLSQLKEDGVENILALRGDVNPDVPPKTDFTHASDLVAYIRGRGDFGVSAACYPEGHLESPDLVSDIRHLKEKVDAGAQHLVSQLFFDNGKYYRFLNMARKAGVTLPISAGVMPIVRRSQIERTVALSSASLPSAFTRMISRWQDDPQSLYQAGIEYAVEQLRDLIEGGADGVHLYAMNDAGVAAAVYAGIRDLL